jgi:hypothetical protein
MMDGMKFKGTVTAFSDYVQYYLGFQVTKAPLCRKLPPEILNDLDESSQQSGRKHKCTPLKGSTPKRKRLLSPGTPSSTGRTYMYI